VTGYVREQEQEQREQEQRPRQSPSPTHLNAHQIRLVRGHRRQESDTLKSMSSSMTGSPTVGNHLTRIPSKSGQGSISPQTTRNSQGRVSPPSRLQNRISPKDRLSPSSSEPSTKRRHSPTASEPPASNTVSTETSLPTSGRTWTTNEREDDYLSERDSDRDRERRTQAQPSSSRLPSPSHSAYPIQPIPAPVPPSHKHSTLDQSAAKNALPPPKQPLRYISVNKNFYTRFDLIGKGGSSRVFRVMSMNNELYALKRVSLDRTDNEMMAGYMNEIRLLKQLEGNHRIIRLIDSEVRAGPGGSKGYLLLIMEYGEIDLARLLQDQMRNPLNMTWVAYYWQQVDSGYLLW